MPTTHYLCSTVDLGLAIRCRSGLHHCLVRQTLPRRCELNHYITMMSSFQS
ncbi:hypothetical protein GBAR_LOCUS21027, partial [Geodia barretti]